MIQPICFLLIHVFFSGVNILFSGNLNQLDVSRRVYSTLIPSFVQMLSSHQKSYPLPPSQYWSFYSGIYDSGLPFHYKINISVINTQGTSTLAMDFPQFRLYLSYITQYVLQVSEFLSIYISIILRFHCG